MTTTYSVPEIITDFFRAQNAHDSAALAAAFTEDAIIADDGQTLQDTAAIRAWSERSNREYQLTVELLEAYEAQGEIICRARVSGAFDGSPLLFFYHFTLRDQKIATLNIHL